VRRFLLAFVLLCAFLFLTHSWWLALLGRGLVHDDGPAPAQAAVVLAGDPAGHRIVRAAQLVRAGYVPEVFVSGPAGMYGIHECDLAIPFAVRQGYPREWFLAVPHGAHSTNEEARFLLAELRRHDIKHYLLVTSDFHSARAARIFRSTAKRMGLDIDFRVITASDEFFRPNTWWQSREGLKTFFFESCKTLATALGV
jgi:uncharacterized SAM-binding protein YcdF (DUF218 family)